MTDALQNSQIKTNGLFEQSEICLFKLSDSGTVLYCRTNLDQQLNGTFAGAVGRNFFDEVSPFENTEELRPLLRPSLTKAAHILRNEGLINYVRGKFYILDRQRLEAAACECYAAVQTNF